MQLGTHILASTLLLGPCSVAVLSTQPAFGTAKDETATPIATALELPISAVTVYRTRAAVTRSAEHPLVQGVHEIRVGPLPESADLESVQAKLGAGARLLDVKTETIALPAPTSDNPRVRDALAAVEEARANLAEVDRRSTNNAASTKLVDSIAAKTATDASHALGSALDPDKLRAQIAFIESERERLTTDALALTKERTKAAGELAARQQVLDSIGGARPAQRYAVVSAAVPQSAAVPVSLTYLVGNATWRPAYTVRGDPDAGTIALEFDAVVKQATGEDWRDVALVLSTAQPTRAANPRSLDPLYLDLFDPRMPREVSSAMPAPGSAMPATESNFADSSLAITAKSAARLEELARDADVGGGGAAVEYRLPRTFTAPSDARGERRTRVANIDGKPTFTLVARPLVESDVFLRARLTNESNYILLPGQARIYLGNDSIGTASLGEIPAGGELELWFGKEPRVTAKRELVSKKASESGLFSKSKGVDREYRISLVNTLSRSVEIEVWDRAPVSRNEQVRVEVLSVAPALATDAKYAKDERPQGLLKWTLPLPARTAGKEAAPVMIGWKTRVVWPESMQLGGDED
jgi:uncharacterized protein (TIGR02231 family)